MITQANKRLHLPLLIGGIAAILISGIAVGSLAISTRSSSGVVAPVASTEAGAAIASDASGARGNRCAECGIIESTRKSEAPDGKTWFSASDRIGSSGEIDRTSLRNYEITIRLRDGSMRVITDAHPARWRPGERVTLIAGMETRGR